MPHDLLSANKQDLTGLAANAGSKAEQAADSASLEVLARVGLIAYGVVHLLIGWLALQIAWGAAGRSADSSGALGTLADQPFGKILLGLVAAGLGALALWQASAALWGYRNHQGATRARKQLTSGAKAVMDFFTPLTTPATPTAMPSSRRSTPPRCPRVRGKAWRGWARSDTSPREWPWARWEACSATRR